MADLTLASGFASCSTRGGRALSGRRASRRSPRLEREAGTRRRRDDRVAECAALEMPCPGKPGPGVRIPLSPLEGTLLPYAGKRAFLLRGRHAPAEAPTPTLWRNRCVVAFRHGRGPPVCDVRSRRTLTRRSEVRGEASAQSGPRGTSHAVNDNRKPRQRAEREERRQWGGTTFRRRRG